MSKLVKLFGPNPKENMRNVPRSNRGEGTIEHGKNMTMTIAPKKTHYEKVLNT